MKRIVRNSLMIGLVITSLGMYSCRETTNKEKEEVPAENQMHNGEDVTDEGDTETSYNENDEVKTTGMASFNDKMTANAYENYLKLKDALVAENPNQASPAAASLTNFGNSDVSEIAKQLSKSDDVNRQRELFSKLTALIEPVFKNDLASGAIYKQYCPMAFEGKGDYWLSNSKQIKNPYFGNKMLNCGRLEETIQ